MATPLPKPGSRAPVVPEYRSPEVGDDRRVTIRYYHPDAKEVWCEGEWSAWNPLPLRPGAGGLWSCTTGPLAPGLYEYSLFADGARVVDYHNAATKNRFAQLVEVPGRGADEMTEVPHGEMHIHWYHSTVSGGTRRIHIYTPPGYDAAREYPVLYLLHGSGDDDESWMRIGRGNFIMDNLLALGRAVPMIVAMPDGHPLGPNWKDQRARKVAAFATELHDHVIPLVEGRYPAGKSAKRRAMAGLSMGGGQTIAAGLPRPDVFSAFGLFSSGLWPEITPLLEPALPALAANPPSLLWIGIGTGDFLYGHCATLRRVLEAARVPFAYHEDGTGHAWSTWRDYLERFVPLLFRHP
jgi:enterochelin esterase-like enzyme